MGVAYGLGLTVIAFLAPLPAERPARREPPKGSRLVVGLVAVFLLAVTITPLSLALAEKWAIDSFATDCRASGGRVTHIPSEDGRPYRCERPRP